MYNRAGLNIQLSEFICGTFPGVVWVGKINNKDHLSPAEAERWAEIGKNDGEEVIRDLSLK